MKNLFLIIFLLFSINCLSQTIIKSPGIPHYNTVPVDTPLFLNWTSELGYNVNTQRLYTWNRSTQEWDWFEGGSGGGSYDDTELRDSINLFSIYFIENDSFHNYINGYVSGVENDLDDLDDYVNNSWRYFDDEELIDEPIWRDGKVNIGDELVGDQELNIFAAEPGISMAQLSNPADGWEMYVDNNDDLILYSRDDTKFIVKGNTTSFGLIVETDATITMPAYANTILSTNSPINFLGTDNEGQLIGYPTESIRYKLFVSDTLGNIQEIQSSDTILFSGVIVNDSTVIVEPQLNYWELQNEKLSPVFDNSINVDNHKGYLFENENLIRLSTDLQSLQIGVDKDSLPDGASVVHIGYRSGYSSSGTDNNTFVGNFSGWASAGNHNTSIGSGAGWNSTGDGNVSIGRLAGFNTDSNNIISIGNFAGHGVEHKNIFHVNLGIDGIGHGYFPDADSLIVFSEDFVEMRAHNYRWDIDQDLGTGNDLQYMKYNATNEQFEAGPLILKAPDDSCWELEVDNSGNVSTVSIICP